MMTDEHVTPQSDRRQLVQARFDAQNLGQVSNWIEQRREDGMSWAHISMALRDLVAMDVSYETLRRWSTRDQEQPGADSE